MKDKEIEDMRSGDIECMIEDVYVSSRAGSGLLEVSEAASF